MNGSCVISLNYKFDYGRFDKLELQNRAKNTLGELFGFVRSTFDGLIEIGRVLQDFYYDCLTFCPNGKQVFEEWLKSDDFGASRYIAKSAIAIYLWFDQLPPKVKRLVRQNVQKWSVSALRQLTKVSNDLVKEIDSYQSDIIPYQQSAITVDIAATRLKGNRVIPSPSPNEIILTPGLQVEDQQIINPDNSENNQTIETPSSGFRRINPGLIGTAHQLANQHEVNGLLLTGLTLKTGISITNALQGDVKPDIQNAGLTIIKRFQQILPEEFIAFKTGDFPQAFKWKDPESNRQYHFCFEAAQTNEAGDIVTPASLKGFEINSGSDLMKPVFVANLIDVRYNHWSIEQCDFNQSQIQSLNLAAKQKKPHHMTAIANTYRDFCTEI